MSAKPGFHLSYNERHGNKQRAHEVRVTRESNYSKLLGELQQIWDPLVGDGAIGPETGGQSTQVAARGLGPPVLQEPAAASSAS